MANEVSESTIRRIQKLLELGSRTKGNEEEAAAAMKMAQDLLAKHNLDIAVVREQAVAGGTVPEEIKRESKKINRSAQYDWQKSLWRTLAMCNFCWHHVQSFQETDGKTRDGWTKFKTVRRHVVLGSIENVTMVHLMGDYLCDTIERLLPFTDNRDRLSRDAISWRAGCAARLEQRLRQQRNGRLNTKPDPSAGTGLMIRLQDIENSEYAGNYDFTFGKGAYARLEAGEKQRAELAKAQPAEVVKPETEAEKRKREAQEARWAKQYDNQQRAQARKYNSSAYLSGYDKGDDISLNSQVKG